MEISRYTGPQKPDPPADSVKVKVMPLRVLARMVLAGDRAAEKDFSFLTDIVEKDDSPEFNAQSLQPKTRAVYLLLIDLPPAKYDTMLTSMLQVERLTEPTGQTFTLFTLDQQLYRIAVEIQWSLPELFPPSFIIQLGGMHLLTSFIEAVGNLMSNTDLADILSSGFAGVAKMMIGKKFPICIRALRIVVEMILAPLITNLKCNDDLMEVLQEEQVGVRPTSCGLTS